MMYMPEEKWGIPVGASLVIHAVVVVFLGIFIQFSPNPTPEPKEPIMVELFSPGDGGSSVLENSTDDTETEEMKEWEEPEPVQSSFEPLYDQQAPEKKMTSMNQTPKKRSAKGKASSSSAGHENGGGTGRGTGSGNGIGNDSGNVTKPVLLNHIRPHYPESAKRAGIEGVTKVGILIGEDGRVHNVWVINSSGNQDLDAAAVNAYYKARFAPAKKNGHSVESQGNADVYFNLHDI